MNDNIKLNSREEHKKLVMILAAVAQKIKHRQQKN